MGLTIGSAAASTALAGGFLFVRRRLHAAALIVGIAVGITALGLAPADAAQTTTTASDPSSGSPVAVATFSGLSGEVEILSVDPALDMHDAEPPEWEPPWTITKALDETSPRLIDALVSGEQLRCVEFRVPADGNATLQGVVALAGVRVGMVRHHSDGEPPIEEVELHYTRLAYRYQPERPDGSLGPVVEGELP